MVMSSSGNSYMFNTAKQPPIVKHLKQKFIFLLSHLCVGLQLIIILEIESQKCHKRPVTPMKTNKNNMLLLFSI